MGWRTFLAASAACLVSLAASDLVTLRGKLLHRDGRPSALELTGGKMVELGGDPDTDVVISDKRLDGADLELLGRYTGAGLFRIEPIHTRAMHVHKNGKKLFITYWCDVCAIRTYKPGKCWCCQQETDLDLRESLPGDEEAKP